MRAKPFDASKHEICLKPIYVQETATLEMGYIPLSLYMDREPRRVVKNN